MIYTISWIAYEYSLTEIGFCGTWFSRTLNSAFSQSFRSKQISILVLKVILRINAKFSIDFLKSLFLSSFSDPFYAVKFTNFKNYYYPLDKKLVHLQWLNYSY